MLLQHQGLWIDDIILINLDAASFMNMMSPLAKVNHIAVETVILTAQIQSLFNHKTAEGKIG